jgi:hypothetical protein
MSTLTKETLSAAANEEAEPALCARTNAETSAIHSPVHPSSKTVIMSKLLIKLFVNTFEYLLSLMLEIKVKKNTFHSFVHR